MSGSRPGGRVWIWILLVALVPVGALSSMELWAAAPPPKTPELRAPWVPGTVLVGLRDGRRRMASRGSDPRALSTLPELAPHPVEQVQVLALARGDVLELRIQVPPGRESQVIRALRMDPRVAFAEPDWYVRGAVHELPEPPVAPNDSYYRAYQWAMQRIGMSRAWAIGQGGPVQVAVIDSGIDLDHPEFQGRILEGKNYVRPGTPPQDDSGHGTHVAGIIGAALDNGIGVAGVAPQVVFDPRKVLNEVNSGSVSDVALAIREAVQAGARIINLSLESPQPSAVLESAVNEAWNAGVLLVASAGNVGQPLGAPSVEDVLWPAAYSVVVAVGATDRFDNPTAYSRRGQALDLTAPGGTSDDLIYSTWPDGVPCPAPLADAGPAYCGAVGTSMSAAFVSGLAALIWGERPELTRAQVMAILYETARKLNAPPEQVGQGRVSARDALRRALPPEIRLEPAAPSYLVEIGAPAFTHTLTLANPSSEPLAWEAQVVSGRSWLTLSVPVSGTVRYGRPGALTAVVSPTALSRGSYTGTIRTVGRRGDGGQTVREWPVRLSVSDPLTRSLYLPVVAYALGDPGPGWQEPDARGRQVYALTDNSSIGLLLPFTYTVDGQAFTTLRLYSDGFVTFPAAHSVDNLPVTCLPEESPAHWAIYGWWADLDPRRGGQVSTFQSAPDIFVVEFADVPSAAGTSPPYTVRFQILLRPDGRVHLVYEDVPPWANPVVVGMEIRDSLLYTQVACVRGSETYGRLPRRGQRLTWLPSDLR